MDTYYHYKIYKPVGYLSQFVNNQNKRKNKLLLGELYNFHPDTMAIGRLDQDSEGLLLLTTNGKLSYKILNSGVEKEYYAQLDGQIDNTSLQNLQKGINISINGKSYLTKHCKVKAIQTPILPKAQRPIKSSANNPTSWISVTLTEGKFRQVRKMTAAVGFPTLRLVRVRIGNETISELDVAEVLPKKEFDI